MNATSKLAIIINGTDNASGVMGKVGGSLGTLGKAAVGLSVAGVAGVAALGAGIMKLAADAAPLEGISKAFEGLATSSGQSADELVRALQRGSAGMVTQRDLMKSYNTAAQLVGTTFANQLPDAMGYLGKVSAATGQDMGYMLDSLVRGVGRLSPMILDNLGIQVDLVSANEAYAASIGKGVDELTKSEQQTALMNQVMEKLALNTAAMPEVAGSAAQGMASLWATFADFKDQIGESFLSVFNDALGAFARLAEQVLPAVASFIETRVVPALGVLRDDILPGLLAKAEEVWGWITGTAIPKLEEWRAAIADKVGAALTWFRDEILPGLKAKAEEVWGWITGTAIPQLEEWRAAVVDKIGAALTTLRDEILPNLLIKAQEAWEGISVAVGSAWEGFKPHLEDIAGMLNTAKDTILPLYVTAWENVKTILSNLAAPFQNLTNTLLPQDQIAWQNLGDAVGDFLTKEVKYYLDKWAGSMETLNKVLEFAAPLIGSIADAVEKLKNPLGDLGDKMGNSTNPAIRYFTDVLNELVHGNPLAFITVAVRQLRDSLGDLANALNINLPSWMQPGSPTPLELGIRGINDAMRDLTRGSFNMSPVAAGVGAMAPAGAMGGGGRGSSVTIGNISINANSEAGGRDAARGFVDALRARGIEV